MNDGSLGRFTAINVTPLVDVMLVLLIVFMVTAPMLGAGLQIEVPRGLATLPGSSPVTVSITEDGRVYVARSLATDPVAAIAKALEESAQATVAVRADGQCRYQAVASAISAARAAGATQIELVFDAEAGQ